MFTLHSSFEARDNHDRIRYCLITSRSWPPVERSFFLGRHYLICFVSFSTVPVTSVSCEFESPIERGSILSTHGLAPSHKACYCALPCRVTVLYFRQGLYSSWLDLQTVWRAVYQRLGSQKHQTSSNSAVTCNNHVTHSFCLVLIDALLHPTACVYTVT